MSKIAIFKTGIKQKMKPQKCQPKFDTLFFKNIGQLVRIAFFAQYILQLHFFFFQKHLVTEPIYIHSPSRISIASLFFRRSTYPFCSVFHFLLPPKRVDFLVEFTVNIFLAKKYRCSHLSRPLIPQTLIFFLPHILFSLFLCVVDCLACYHPKRPLFWRKLYSAQDDFSGHRGRQWSGCLFGWRSRKHARV